jgi:flagellar biogenesis protein FliO
MKTLVSKGLFRVARASRLISHLIGALTLLGIIVFAVRRFERS